MAVAETEMLGRGSALAQLFALLYDIAFTFCSSLVRSLLLASRLLFQRTRNARISEGGAERIGEVEFYEGKVWHERRKPVVHRFEYNVRYAFVNLDKPASWFDASQHMTAYEARSIAATAGPVYFSCLALLLLITFDSSSSTRRSLENVVHHIFHQSDYIADRNAIFN